MEVSMVSQLMVAVLSSLVGIFLGALYDIIRIWRAFLGIVYVNKVTGRLQNIKLPFIRNPIANKKHMVAENVVMFFTDIVYFLVATLVLVLFVYRVNQGIIRWYIFVGALLGLLIYYVTLGKLVISVSEYIVFFIKVAFSYVTFLISSPFRIAFRRFKCLFIRWKSNLRKSVEEKKKDSKNRQECIKIGK